jgi:hypothetical protein
MVVIDQVQRFCTIYSSIGNFLLAAAQAFFRSLPSAIFLFSSITNSQVVLFPFPNIRRPYPDTGEYHSRNYNKSYCYYRSRAGKHKTSWISDSHVPSPVDEWDAPCWAM